MRRFLWRYWFFLGIALVIFTAFQLPFLGEWLRRYKILKGGIFLAFLITGLHLETRKIMEELRSGRTLIAALISSLLLIPLTAWVLAQVFFRSTPDFIVGTCIIAVAPATIASGTVMTAIAGGNIPLSLFICVASNFVAIFTIPVSLDLLLQFGRGMELPVLKMIQSLLLIVLIPTLIGQVLRQRLLGVVSRYRRHFSVFSQVIVLMIIFNAVSSSTARIAQVGLGVVMVLGFMVLLHGLVLAGNYTIARLLRLDAPSTAAFTIHTSQKTLTVSYLVWSGYFSSTYPLAMIGPIGYHLTQMIVDTMVAHRFRTLTEAAAAS